MSKGVGLGYCRSNPPPKKRVIFRKIKSPVKGVCASFALTYTLYSIKVLKIDAECSLYGKIGHLAGKRIECACVKDVCLCSVDRLRG